MRIIERITITLSGEMAQTVRGAVQSGEYASSSEIVREDLRDWRHKRALQEQELAELRVRVRRGWPTSTPGASSARERSN
jgi:antitoxin ParD1/3/4